MSQKVRQIKKRFNILLLIASSIALINLLVPSITTSQEVFRHTTWILFGGVGLWFFSDFEMLQYSIFFRKCLFISICSATYGYMLVSSFHFDNPYLAMGTSLYPISLLLVQWPARRVYLKIFKREPEVDRNGLWPDRVYTLILFVAWALIPLFIADYLPLPFPK